VKYVGCIQFFVILTSLQIFLAGQGFAEDATAEPMPAEPPQWTVGIGIPIGLEIHDVSASSSTGFVGSPSRIWDDLGQLQLLRFPSSGDARVTGVTFGGELEIMSPRIFDTFGQPRIFARSALEMNLAADTIPTAEGGIGPIRPPSDASGNPPSSFTERSILGQGSEGLYKVDRLQIRVGAGVAFSLVFMDRPLRIKPSIEYLRREAEMRGHAIGPGLELEMDTGRLGPLVVSVFGGFRALRFLGTRKEELKGQTSAGEDVTFNFELDQWLYRADTGLRFRWQPE